MDPIQNKQELSIEESVKQIMPTLPPPVRQYLAEGRPSKVAATLMGKYGLHVDQGGIIERELMLLLMGLESPEEFAQSLKEDAQLGNDVLGGMVNDINQELLTPLRDEMRKGAEILSKNQPKPQAPGPTIIQPTLRPATQPVQPPVRITPPTVPAPKQEVAPLPPKIIMPRLAGSASPAPSADQPVIPAPPDHMLPTHSSPEATKGAAADEPALPAQSTPSTQILPGTNVPVPDQKPAGPPPPTKQYGTDPYREPIE